MLGNSISTNGLLLGAFALVTAGALSMTFLSTKDRIAQEERKAAQKALLEIVPAERHNNDLLLDTIAVPEKDWALLGLKATANIHMARDNNQLVAVIIPATAADGYNGDIKLIVGVNRDGTIAGVRTLSHKETPGLGDKVDLKKSNWILNFNNTSWHNPTAEMWKVKKDGGAFDQFTAATITPRAVVKQVRKVLTFFNKSQALLLASEAEDQLSRRNP